MPAGAAPHLRARAARDPQARAPPPGRRSGLLSPLSALQLGETSADTLKEQIPASRSVAISECWGSSALSAARRARRGSLRCPPRAGHTSAQSCDGLRGRLMPADPGCRPCGACRTRPPVGSSKATRSNLPLALGAGDAPQIPLSRAEPAASVRGPRREPPRFRAQRSWPRCSPRTRFL